MLKSGAFDSQIRDTLSEAADQIAASDLLKIRIKNSLSTQTIKEEPMKKIFSIKRVVILAAVICVLATATVFAAGGITHYTSSSYRGNAYTKIPSADKLSKDIGFTPKIIAAFSNGYAFKDAEPVGTNGQSEENQNLTSFKELSTTYCAPDGKSVTLTSCETGSFEGGLPKVDQTESYKTLDLKYNTQAYRFVPENYQLTDADKAAQADGSVIFSFGSDAADSETIQSVGWSEGGIDYSLMTQNTSLTSADLFSMAHELIDMA